MKNLNFSIILVGLTGCPVAKAYDVKVDTKCVIDQCGQDTCDVETPEGWVVVDKRDDYQEGKKITCPTWLVEPT